jgi:hypothetical protein
VSGFDYNAPDVSDDVIRAISAEMSDGKLKPLTDAEKMERQIQREIWHEEQEWLSEQRHRERERQQAEAEAVARQEAAIALAESNRKARLAMLERDKERNRDRQMTDLHYRARQAELWQSNFDAAARNAVAYRARQTLMSELENMLSPPAPPETLPHTQTVVVSEDEHGSPRLGDRDFNPKLWTKI